MDFELKAAKAKWEREQKQRKEEAKAKLQREKKAKEEAARLREALETAQTQRRLQEAQAVAAEKLQEERDSFDGDGIRFNVVLQATQVAGDGDKIKLPPSAFEHLSSQGALEKGPMFFEIALNIESPTATASEEWPDAIDNKITHCGVLEFTAPEGFAELPPHVWSNAGLSDLPLKECPYVRIRYMRLPKCTFAKLQPDNSDFADVPNHKAVLETKLRQHATLSEGDFLVIQHEGVEYKMCVSDLKPSANVSVLETDMEVDVVSIPGMASHGRLSALELGKPQSGCVEEGSYVYYKFAVDVKVLEALNRGDMNLIVHLEINEDGKGSDADLYVAAHPVLFPSQHQHQWASHDLGSKIIHLTGREKPLSSGSYSIAVYGYRGRAMYKVWVQTQPTGPVTGQRVGLASREMEGGSALQPGFEVCENCRQVIPSRTAALHEAYCRRHNIVCTHPGCGVVLRQEEFKKHVHCSKCGQSLQQEELEKHLKVYHEPQVCRCGATLERDDMVKHQASNCPLRTIMCRFCGDMVQAGKEAENFRDRLRGLTQHESQCGSRTSPCEVCGRAIMLKEMDLHRAAAHDPNSREGMVKSSVDANVTGDTHLAKQTKFMNCPVCNLTFEGAAADTLMNAHLDDEHFLRTTHHPVEQGQGDQDMNAALSSSYKRSLSVACPICGLAVHSERDLSVHMDMVH
ncbi:hypothetical protein GOP47_0022842 [Adiantum capillus-veneris]|uniref:C2H2-type domain-containing protein n=1 Tax=Adiantum capillus-veneris TaxID=13818 RepID=A0A9D4Z4P0_ADICA|nr:hypothetical protein GOP47_0022842 [Adiantum capillus-veneris]